MNKVNNKVRREIAYALSTYIYKRLIANRELQKLKFEGKENELVDIDQYIDAIKMQEELIDSIDEREEKSKVNETLTKSDLDKILEEAKAKGNSVLEEAIKHLYAEFKTGSETLNYRDEMVIALNYMRDSISKRVIMSESNIEEIRELVDYFAKNLDYPTSSESNENFFLRQVYMEICKNGKVKRMVDLAEKYANFFSSREDAGFDANISGQVSFGYLYLVSIYNQDRDILFDVDKNHNITKSYIEGEDYILFGSNIAIGFKTNEDGSKSSEMGRIIIDNGERYFHTVLTDNKVYPISNEEDENKFGTIQLYKGLKSYLEELGLESYYSHVFNKESLSRLRSLINNFKHTSKEEIDDYEKLADVASCWWTNTLTNPPLSTGFEGNNGKQIDNLALDIQDFLTASRESLATFKELLKRKIVGMLIMSDYLVTIGADYHLDRTLSECASEAGISALLVPYNTDMTIDKKSIKVKEGRNGEYRALYSLEPQAKRELK